MKTKLKTLVLLLTIAVSTTFAQRDWTTAAMTATNGETIRIASTGTLGTLTVPNNATITIISDGEEPIARSAQLNISIGYRATVIWKAKIIASAAGTSHGVSLTFSDNSGSGTFEVHSGAIIKRTGAGNAINSTSQGSKITVLGGEVSATGTGAGINSSANSTTNIVTVSGGVVSATTGRAINVNTSFAIINIDGGLVIAQGTAINDNVLSKAPNHTGGLVIAYPGSGSYVSGTRDGLLSLPSNANISWVRNGEIIGIQYDEERLFLTDGTQLIWDWSRDGVINNAKELSFFRDVVNNGMNFLNQTVTLGADIELSGNWRPIGDSVNANNTTPFRGTFDGNGRSISNLSVSGVARAGLFGYVGADGQIKNLTINVTNMTVNSSGSAGGLSAIYASEKPIENIVVNISDRISGSGSNLVLGGLTGRTNLTTKILNSYVTGNITSGINSGILGGLVGQTNAAMQIENSYFTGDILANGTSGGLVGEGRTTINITRSYSMGNILGTNRAGGLIGYASGSLGIGIVNIDNSFASGDVSANGSGTTYSGGLIGQTVGRTDIVNSYASGVISASGNQRFLGGISGNWSGGETENVYFRLVGATHASGGDVSLFGVEGKTTAEFRQKATFVNWDFENIWGIHPDFNNGFPFLRHFNQDFNGDDDNNGVLVPVTEITNVHSQFEFNGIPSDPMMMIGLDGTVLPADATNRNIVWSYVSGTATGFVNGENLIVASPGTFEVRATIINGLGTDQNYVQYFSIVVTQANLPSCDENAHTWADNWTTTIPATCEAQGVETRICTNENCTHPETRQIAQLTGEACQNSGNVSIRQNETRDTRYGIILENGIVSDAAKISVITPEPAQITLKILDNLGNVVHTVETQCLASQNCTAVWNLTNTAGRFVANGTYLIVVEARSANGRIYRYSAQIGVSR